MVFGAAFLDEGAAFSADAGDPGMVSLWDLRGRRSSRTFRAPGSVRFLEVADPGRLVVAGLLPQSGGRFWYVSVIDAATGRELRRIEEMQLPATSISGIAAMPGGRVLVSYDDRGVPETSCLWSLDSGQLVRRYRRAADAVTSDRRWGLQGRTIWEIDAERVKARHPVSGMAWGVAIAPGGLRAVSQGSGSAFLWNGSGTIRTFGDQRGWLWSGAFTPDGRLLITGSDSQFVLRDGLSGESIADLDGHEGKLRSVATSPSGRHALSGDSLGSVLLWQLPAPAGSA